jgi:hypothetical protein
VEQGVAKVKTGKTGKTVASAPRKAPSGRPAGPAPRGATPAESPVSTPASAAPEAPAPLRHFVPVLAAAAVLGFVLACFDVEDFDLWWQLRAGQWIAEHHGAPQTEVFTHTREGMPWVDTEWGAELLLYLAMSAGGATGLIVLVGAIAAAVACCVVLAARDEGAGPASAGLAAGGVLFLLHFRLFPRAEVFTLLCMALLVLLLARWRRGRRWPVYAIPPLFVAWGNLHPGVLSGGMVLAAYVAAEALVRLLPPRAGAPEPQRPLLPLFAASALAALALLVNPYGYRLPLEWLRLSGSEVNKLIVEWLPPTHEMFTNRPFVHAYRVWTGILLVSLPLLWARRRLGGILAAAALLPLAMRHVRIIAVYGIATAPAMAAALHGWFTLAAGRRAATLRLPAALATASLLLLGALLVVEGSFYRWEGEQRRFGFGVSERDYPVRALAFLRANDIRGTVFNEYRWGGWLGWVEGMKVFQDGRTIDESLFREASAVLTTAPGFEAILDRYRIDLMILRYPKEATRSKAIFRWLDAQPDWALVFWDDDALVYVRRNPRFQAAVDRFAYRHVFPFPRQVPMTELRNHRAEIEAEIARVKAWSPRSVLVRQFAGQLYSLFGMADRAKAEFVDGYRLDPSNPFWEPQLKALGAWPPG